MQISDIASLYLQTAAAGNDVNNYHTRLFCKQKKTYDFLRQND